MKTGWESMRLAILAYIVPFIFALSPTLLLIGHWTEVTLSIITAVIGATLLGIGLVGYLFRPVGIVRRILFLIAAVGLLVPVVSSGPYAALTWASNGVGVMLAAILFVSEWLRRSARARAPTAVVADS